MKQFKDMKLGDEIERKELGDFADLFEDRIRLLKITYTFQDDDGTTADVKLVHKDFWDEDDDKEEKSEVNDDK